MFNHKVISRNNSSRVAESLVTVSSAEEISEANDLKFIDLDVHQAQYLQTIGDGWAYPLKRFMNELELLEVIHNNT